MENICKIGQDYNFETNSKVSTVKKASDNFTSKKKNLGYKKINLGNKKKKRFFVIKNNKIIHTKFKKSEIPLKTLFYSLSNNKVLNLIKEYLEKKSKKHAASKKINKKTKKIKT